MANEGFCFKQFSIKHDKCAMKVGTDAVLLGAWTSPDNSERILDIGTGTGIIALMLAQKSSANIDAIDIDENACLQAKENINNSKWNNKISVHHTSLQKFSENTSAKYDLIISNPPYFIDCSKATGLERTNARHADTLPYQELLNGVVKLLSAKGKFYVILPLKEGELFRDMAEEKKIYLSRLTRVHTRADKSTEKRWLMQFEPERKTFSEDSLTIELDERHNYTEEYKALTKDYYIAF